MNSAFLSIIAGLGGMFGWGMADFFGGLCSRKKGPFFTLFWSQSAGLVITFFLILFLKVSLRIPASAALLLPIAPMLYAGALLLFYKAFEKGTISIIAATVNLWVVFSMFFAFIFLDQRLSKFQFFGAFMIIAGITFVSLKLSDIRAQNLNRSSGIKETVLAAFLFGLYFNVSDVILEEIGWLPTTLFVKVGIIFYLLLFSIIVKRNINLSEIAVKTKLMVVLVGVLDATASTSVNYGLSVGDSILISPITSALSIVTIAMAIIFLKEKITKTQGFGIVMAISGIILAAF
jgi:drug/metabolite transporter (DMT)-like permease